MAVVMPLAQPWTPLAPNDTDVFSINPAPLMAQDGSQLLGEPQILCSPSDMIASAVSVDSRGYWNFSLTASSATGIYTITAVFTLTTRGPLHRSCLLEVQARS